LLFIVYTETDHYNNLPYDHTNSLIIGKFFDTILRVKCELSLCLVNVQGLTDVKMVDVVRVLREKMSERDVRLIGLVETHEKYGRRGCMWLRK